MSHNIINSTTNFHNQVVSCLEGALKISPDKLGEFFLDKSGEVPNFLACAEFWKKASSLFHDASLSQICSNDYRRQVGSDFPLRLAYVASCAFNAARAFQSESIKQKLKEQKNDEWNELDAQALEFFKHAIWAHKGIDTSDFPIESRIAFKERSLRFLYALCPLQSLKNDLKISKTTAKIFKKELKLAGLYEKVISNDKWKAKLNTAWHLKQAALFAPTPEQQRSLLLKAKVIIIGNIWRDCPLSYPEFFSDHRRNQGYALLGDIQILLHQGFCPLKFKLVVVKCYRP